MKFMNVALASCVAFAGVSTMAKRRKTTTKSSAIVPVHIEYADIKDTLHHGDIRIATDYDSVMVEIFSVKPITTTIDLYKEYVGEQGFAIWTNSSGKSFRKKQEYVAHHYAEHYMQHTFAFCKDNNHKKGRKRKNASERFFVDAYNGTMAALGLDPEKAYLIFIDDCARNVREARAIAEKHGLNIIAIHYTDALQLEGDLAWVYGKEDILVA